MASWSGELWPLRAVVAAVPQAVTQAAPQIADSSVSTSRPDEAQLEAVLAFATTQRYDVISLNELAASSQGQACACACCVNIGARV